MRSKRASPRRFTSFARVCPPIRHDRLRIFFPVGQGPEGVIGSDSRLGHEACKWTSRKKLKFLKAVTSPRLRSASPDRLIRLSPRPKNMRSESCPQAAQTRTKLENPCADAHLLRIFIHSAYARICGAPHIRAFLDECRGEPCAVRDEMWIAAAVV